MFPKKFNYKCIPLTGIIFPSHTNYTFNIEKNSVIIEISLDDKIQDIEKLKDSTI